MAGEIKSGSEGPAGDDDEIIIIISVSVRSDRANDIVSFAKKLASGGAKVIIRIG